MWSPPWRLALAAPGLLGGYALSSIASNDTTGAKVPLAMLAMPLAFYLVMQSAHRLFRVLLRAVGFRLYSVDGLQYWYLEAPK